MSRTNKDGDYQFVWQATVWDEQQDCGVTKTFYFHSASNSFENCVEKNEDLMEQFKVFNDWWLNFFSDPDDIKGKAVCQISKTQN